MAQTLIQRGKKTLMVHRLVDVENDIRDMRTNQVHSAITEIQVNTNDQHEFTNHQVWIPLNNCAVKIVFDDWIYQNFYFEGVMSDNSGSGVHHTAEARMYDYVNNAEFAGSEISTTAFNDGTNGVAAVVRSGLLTKPAQTGAYSFREEYGIDVGGLPDSYCNLYMGRFIIRYEGG